MKGDSQQISDVGESSVRALTLMQLFQTTVIGCPNALALGSHHLFGDINLDFHNSYFFQLWMNILDGKNDI